MAVHVSPAHALERVAVSPSAIQATYPKTPAHRMRWTPTKPTGKTYSLDNATTMPEFVDLVSARILIFRLLAYPPTKIRCTFTYMRGENYVKTDKLWLQHSALAGDGLDKVCMERGTLQNLYDYAVEKMARVKNKTG